MASKTVQPIAIELGIKGGEKLAALNRSFRDLSKQVKLSDADITQATKDIVKFATEAGNSEATIKGQIKAFEGLREQAALGGKAYIQLGKDIESLKVALRGSTDEMEQQRAAFVKTGNAAKSSASDIAGVISELENLRNKARPGSSAFAQLGKDIAALKSQLQEANVEVKKFNAGFEISQRPAMSLEKIQRQIGKLAEGLKSLNFISDEFLNVQERIALLGQVQGRTTARQQVRAQAQMYSSAAFANFVEGPAGKLSLPNTTAALQLEVSELQQKLVNLDRSSSDYTATAMRLADAQRKLAQDVMGLSSAYDKLGAAEAGAARRAGKVAGIQQYYAGGAAAPGVAGFRDPATGAIIARGAGNVADRRAFLAAQRQAGLSQYSAPISPELPEAIRKANEERKQEIRSRIENLKKINKENEALREQAAINRSIARGRARSIAQVAVEPPVREISGLYRQIGDIEMSKITASIEMMGQSYSAVATDIKKATAASNGSIASLNNQRSAWSFLRDQLNPASKQFRDVTKELEKVDRALSKVQRRRGLSPMQMTQAAGAAISGGIFGGPEGFLGGAIGAIGGVGGAFAGAAIGAQIGGLRRQLAEFADYAAGIQRLEIALKGVAGSQSEFNKALLAARNATDSLNVPQETAIQGITRLTAAVKGAGGNVGDASLAFRNISSAIIATGGGAEQVEGAITALVQIFSKGKVSMEEINQIAERLPGTFNTFAEAAGMTGPEMLKALQQGKVGLNDLMSFLIEVGNKYNATASSVANSSQSAGAKLQVAFNDMRIAVGESLQPIGAEFQAIFTNFIEDVTPAMVAVLPEIGEAFLVLAENLDVLAISAGTAFAAMGVAKIAAVGGLGAALLKLAAAAGTASGALQGTAAAALLNPWVALAAGVSAATVGIYKYYEGQKELNALLDDGAGSTQVIKDKILEYEDSIRKATEKLKGINGEQKATGRDAQRLKKEIIELKGELDRLKGTYKIRIEYEQKGYKFGEGGAMEEFTVGDIVYGGPAGARARPLRRVDGTPLDGVTDFKGPTVDTADSEGKKAARDAERRAEEIASLKRALALGEAKGRIFELEERIKATGIAIVDAQNENNFAALRQLQGLERSLEYEKRRAEIVTQYNAKMREIKETSEGEIRDLKEKLASQERSLALQRAEVELNAQNVAAQQQLTQLKKEQSKSFEQQFTDRQRELGLVSELQYNEILMARELQRLAGIEGLTPEQRQRGIELYRQEIDPTPFESMRQNITKLKDELRELVDPINQITSAATAIGDAFSQSFADAISGSKTAKEALADFFSSVGSYFLDMAKQIIAKMIQIAILNTFAKVLPSTNLTTSSGVGLSAGAATQSGFSMGSSLASMFANGGIMTEKGPLELNRYASGGIARGPQLAMFGEGRMPEAYVPLPDGRSIPVTMEGGKTSTNVVVNVDASGTSVQGDDRRGKEFGNAISAAVQAELIKHQRPGGLLNR